MNITKSSTNKISPQFASRLNSLSSNQKVRAIVLLDTQLDKKSNNRRQNYIERQQRIQKVQERTNRALRYLDEILEEYRSSRLSEKPDALGTVHIEATSAGIKAIAKSKWTKAVIEDQEVFQLK